MTPEQLQAAYDKGYDEAFESAEGEATIRRRRIAEAAGLAEVARQQAEHDAQIADADFSVGTDHRRENYVRQEIATAIRAQFENVDRAASNPITATPEEN